MNIDEMPAGPELDALVAEKVMGLRPVRCAVWGSDGWLGKCTYPDHYHEKISQYSTDIAAAWEVLQKACELSDRDLAALGPPRGGLDSLVWEGCSVVELEYHDFSRYAHGETVPLAICRAALKAVGA